MQKLKPLALLLAVAFVGGSASSLSKVALEHIPVYGFTFIRLIVGTLVTFALMRLSKKSLTWSKFKLFAPITVFWWTSAFVFNSALTHTTAANVQFIQILTPALTAVLAGILLHQKINSTKWLGILVASCGVAIVVVSTGKLTLGSAGFVGSLLSLMSATVASVYFVGSNQKKYRKLHAFEMLTIGGMCGSVVALILAIVEYPNHPWLGTVPTHSLIAGIASAAIIGLFYGGFQLLINNFGPSYATLNLYLLPSFVAFWAYVILGETVTTKAVIGAIVALLGVWIVTYLGDRKVSKQPVEVAGS